MNTLYIYHQKVAIWLQQIKEKFNQGECSEYLIETKSNNRDLVTEIDREIEQYLVDKINIDFPIAVILGEESYDPNQHYSLQQPTWIIDPIDGTANFIKQKRDFCVMLAYFDKGEPLLSYIYDVVQDDLYYAIKNKGVFHNGKKLISPENINMEDALISTDVYRLRNTALLNSITENSFDIRYIGCSGLDGIRTVLGQFGGFINPRGGAWDYAPLILMANELNLHISDFSGGVLVPNKKSSFIISTPNIYEKWKEIYQKNN